ncbi:AMP-binding protein [Acidiferrobacter sp.]|uniref:AMP-binding protein n=1 Tax=Acidiferrobacter sp. TaxID=1872107 RepID=UPI00263265EE|nr:AMP-binding protein [Acidiferrobacter sp.]
MTDISGSAALTTASDPAGVFAFYRGRPRPLAHFLCDVRNLAALWPARGEILNACADRYHFMVGLAAAAVAGRMTILPATHAAEVIKSLRDRMPDLHCLADGDVTVNLPTVRFPQPGPEVHAAPMPPMPRIPLDRPVVTVFTSGTTGAPVGHVKTWGSLVAGARAEAARLKIDDGPPWALVATVPPQHMYGLESSVMLGLHGRALVHNTRPFYPDDIVRALAAVPRPRLLVTSPVHLRALLASSATPMLDAVLCATAPLPRVLACEAEQRLHAPLYEIYGATEAGQIATRRPTCNDLWTLFPGLVLEARDQTFIVRGGHVEIPAALGDILEPTGPHDFRLHGRGADIVNVAGKRSSIAFLEQQLLAIPGVIDGAFYMPDEDLVGPVSRLTAFAVAPGLTAGAIEAALRTRLDPVFLPRPLVLVDALPRLATGKLPLAAMRQFLASHMAKARGGYG